MEIFKTTEEVNKHWKRVLLSIYPLHIRRINFNNKPKVGKNETRVKMFREVLQDVERAEAGNVFDTAAACRSL